jgi:hypothetical protein
MYKSHLTDSTMKAIIKLTKVVGAKNSKKLKKRKGGKEHQEMDSHVTKKEDPAGFKGKSSNVTIEKKKKCSDGTKMKKKKSKDTKLKKQRLAPEGATM